MPSRPSEPEILTYLANRHFSFPGDRWARSLFDNDIVLIMDGNGFIAGMQSAVPLDKTADEAFYDFSQVSYYQEGDFFGNDVYYVTAYFVDPSIICNGGRSQAQFDAEGTGNRIAIQAGPTPADVEVIPLEEAGLADSVSFNLVLTELKL